LLNEHHLDWSYLGHLIDGLGRFTSMQKSGIKLKTGRSGRFRYWLATHPACVSTGKRPNAGVGSLRPEQLFVTRRNGDHNV